MTAFSNGLTRVCNWVERIVYWLVFAFFCSLILIVFLQVIARYILANPWLWTVDLSLFCLIWATFLAAGIGVRHHSHVVIDLWPTHWRRVSVVLSWVTILVVFVVSVFYLVQGWSYAINSMSSFSGMTSISMFYFLLAIPVGATLMLLFSFEEAVKYLSKSTGEENKTWNS